MSKATFKITEQSNGVIDSLISQIKDTKSKNIYVGIQKENERKEEITTNKLTNAQIGLYNEFGTETVPERSFIRSTLRENRQKYSSQRQQICKLILNGKISIEKAYSTLGEVAARDIKNKIRDLRTPPNSEETIRRKKSSNPLIDTGQMRNSINYLVATRKEIES